MTHVDGNSFALYSIRYKGNGVRVWPGFKCPTAGSRPSASLTRDAEPLKKGTTAIKTAMEMRIL
jgi:hypothetical protein